ncbi:short-chain fatty acid transporter [Klebsiella sp. R445]
MSKITHFFTELMRRYLPDPFVFAILLTLLTMALAFVIEGRSPLQTTMDWGNGFWQLLSFTTQMAVILAMGYVLAAAPLVDRFLNRIVSHVHTPRTAIIVATLVGSIGSYLNWGFGLVIGSIIAKKLARSIPGVHYPLIIAAAYSGFTFYGLGFSATIPLLISTQNHALEAQMGIISLSETIFSLPMLLTTTVLLVTLPLLNASLHPRKGEKTAEYHEPEAPVAPTSSGHDDLAGHATFAAKLNHSKLTSYTIGTVGMVYVVGHFVSGGVLDLNIINYFILFLGVILLGTPLNYVEKLNEGIRTIGGIILQFPFYAGIMAIMAASGLVKTIAELFVQISTPETLPFWGLISSFFINFFAPSGGGHWVVQGPFMIDAAQSMQASLAQTSMSVMLGNAWNDLVQPFWLLPALAISRLKLQSIMGYTVVMMMWVGVVYMAAILLWPHLG